MKRKTNLFYSSGPDSKFLTFSNYTEALTGNFLSTDTKLYPSVFLCLDIPELNDESNKKIFIENYLSGYYENKLAFLHDNLLESGNKPEDYLLPLNYLLETISKFLEDYSPNTTLNSCLNYIGDITEQDYNGTYTDTICIIDFNNYYIGSLETDDSTEKRGKEYSETTEYLYGWLNTLSNYDEENEEVLSLPSIYKTIKPIFDEGNPQYNYTSKIKAISLISPEENEKNVIKFNIIIPLFDIVNINYRVLEYVDDKITNSKRIGLDLQNGDDPYRKNSPLGIWFAGKTIELERDINTGFSQSWSLLISSQFKPFPYGNMNFNQNTNTESNSNAFPTFAMIISRQNDILDKFEQMSSTIMGQTNQINELNNKINNKSIDINIDKIKKEFIEFEYSMTNKFNTFKQEVQQFMENLAWNSVV